MSRLSATELRKDTADILNRVAYGGDRVILHRREKDVAVIISVEDYALLRSLEDAADLAAVRKFRTSRGKRVDWENLKKECGI